MAYVYVLSENGGPLMPTTRCGHVRRLLQEGKAEVVERRPFTIRLLYETKEKKQPVLLGIDPGRTNIGMAAINETGEPLYLAKLETRNKEIPQLMSVRASYRRQHRKLARRDVRIRRAVSAMPKLSARRIERLLPGYSKPVVCHSIRNKEARFSNRKRSSGWLTPTASHLLLTHVNFVRKVIKVLPVTDIVIEVNRFAFLAMDHPGVKKWQYQKGPLFGKGGVDEAVYEQQEGKCLLCGKEIEHFHHIVPVSKGGSDTIANKAGLCSECHDLVHKDAEMESRLKAKKAGVNKKYHALSVLNQIIPYLVKECTGIFGEEHIYVMDGASTKAYRDTYSIPKDHDADAYCIVASTRDVFSRALFTAERYRLRQYRRHDRQATHKENVDRKYTDETGRVVCMNRHKRTEQKTDSLAEYRKKYGDRAVSVLSVKPHPKTYKDMDRWMPGSLLLCEGEIFVLQASSGRYKGNPYYYISTDGARFPAKKSKLSHNNTGICYVSNHL